MTLPIMRKLTEKFDEEIRFFKGWIDGPKAVGAILPTSAFTARRMASVIRPDAGLPVLELGPGTGVITKAILETGIAPQRLWSVEYSAEFVAGLRDDFPGVNVVHGDAFDLDTALGKDARLQFDAVISAVPMLNFTPEQRVALVEDFLDRVPAGRPVVQITYGPLSPVPAGKGTYAVEHFDFVIRNLPPAQLWIYRRGGLA